MHLLEVPAVLSGFGLYGNHRNREQIITGADATVEIRPRVAGGEIDEAEVGIDGWSLPNAGSAMFPCVIILWPGVVAEFARAGNRIERPDQAAVLGVESLYAPARAILAASKADDDLSVVVER